jgi:hypothetical protein
MVPAVNAKMVRKRSLLRHFILKVIIFPRQARDKRGGNSQNRTVSRSDEGGQLVHIWYRGIIVYLVRTWYALRVSLIHLNCAA